MLENYVCKIYVSDNSNPSSFREATAFGFDDGTSAHLLTAAHVVTDVLGKKYPSSNNQKLYVIFHNHLGPVNTIPVPVEFILKDCNDQSNFQGNMPFVDSAKMILPSGMKQPVSHYFKRRPRRQHANIWGRISIGPDCTFNGPWENSKCHFLLLP